LPTPDSSSLAELAQRQQSSWLVKYYKIIDTSLLYLSWLEYSITIIRECLISFCCRSCISAIFISFECFSRFCQLTSLAALYAMVQAAICFSLDVRCFGDVGVRSVSLCFCRCSGSWWLLL